MVRRFRWLMIPLGLYLALVLLITLAQRSMMYHPPRLAADELKLLAEQHRLLPWTNAAGLRIGWFRPSTNQPAATTVLICHGNSGSAAGREYIAGPLQEAVNAEVYVLEYPGFADRPGSPSQNSILAAGEEGFHLAARQGKVLLVGESLGTGVASYLAGKYPTEVRGVVLLVPYDNTVNAARAQYPWLPVRWLLWDRFASDEWLVHYRGPVVFALAEKDEVLPMRLGRRLHDLYPGPKMLEICWGVGHWLGSNRPSEFWGRAWNFIARSSEGK